jgi:hypothetical protein
MFTGHTGLTRVLRAKKIPVPIVQKYFNKWLSTAYDLFGTDHSSSAHWAYTWGIKGRYDEHAATMPADKDKLNDLAREHYMKESQQLIDQLNQLVPDCEIKLKAPDLKFKRSIGEHVGKTYSVTGGCSAPRNIRSISITRFPTLKMKKSSPRSSRAKTGSRKYN